MKARIVILKENMLDAEEREIFQSDIPYKVDVKGNIENEDGLKVPLNHIWVDFQVEWIGG